MRFTFRPSAIPVISRLLFNTRNIMAGRSDVLDGRADSIFECRCFTMEIHEKHAIGGSRRSIAAACCIQCVGKLGGQLVELRKSQREVILAHGSVYCPNIALGRKVLIAGNRIMMISARMARKKKGRMPRKMSSRDTSWPSGICVATERTV